MNNNQLDIIKNVALNGKLHTDSTAWERIAHHLDNTQNKRKIKRLSVQRVILSVASCAILVFACYQLDLFKSDQIANTEPLALVDTQVDGIYSVENIHKMKRIYK